MASTSWAVGSYTATYDGVSTLTITVTATGGFVASFAGASVAAITTSPEYLAFAATALTAAPLALGMAATTGTAGFALQNATPTILTWTAPADGAMHRFQVFGLLAVSSAATGGQLTVQFTDPGGSSRTLTLLAASQSAGGHNLTGEPLVCQAGQTVTLAQATAMTAGAAILYAELWAA